MRIPVPARPAWPGSGARGLGGRRLDLGLGGLGLGLGGLVWAAWLVWVAGLGGLRTSPSGVWVVWPAPRPRAPLCSWEAREASRPVQAGGTRDTQNTGRGQERPAVRTGVCVLVGTWQCQYFPSIDVMGAGRARRLASHSSRRWPRPAHGPWPAAVSAACAARVMVAMGGFRDDGGGGVAVIARHGQLCSSSQRARA